MARDESIETRLQEWAQWVGAGRRAQGFPVMSVLHPSWLPPAPGQRPMMKVAAGNDRRHRETHLAIESLSLRLSNTVVVHYCLRLPIEQQAQRLQCQPSTVQARVCEAHKRLQAWLSEARLTA